MIGQQKEVPPCVDYSLYGKIDDMELIEWEGELETLQRIQKRLKSLEEIVFEYR